MDGNGAVAQIEWEHRALASSYTKSYYFTRDTVQPIVLLELGKHLANPVNMFIAIENGYQRKTDVLVQSDLAIRHANVPPATNSYSTTERPSGTTPPRREPRQSSTSTRTILSRSRTSTASSPRSRKWLLLTCFASEDWSTR